MIDLYKKELGYYLNNPIGYIIIVVFGLFANFLFIKDIFVIGSASMRPFFSLVPWLLIVFVPALAMRIFAEEKRTNTIEVLLTMPITETGVVLAKFFALLTLVFFSLTLTISLPVSLAVMSKLYLPEIIIGYFGLILLGASFASLAMFFSSLTKNQVTAFLVSVVILFLISLFSSDFFGSVFPKIIKDYLGYFGPLYHLNNFVKGVVDFRSLFYFLSFITTFFILTIVELKKRD